MRQIEIRIQVVDEIYTFRQLGEDIVISYICMMNDDIFWLCMACM